ncbi:nucleotidyltransferase domain-containing protein [Clostridium sp.]|uniref:nucleotidyltransferase domain-containing protein n=1 Tax=Clostridium sp. TaxID=1506 RepID=UPI002621DA3A|nr:nucleotidyltransferase domain-containing protein [Clostridium sp.]
MDKIKLNSCNLDLCKLKDIVCIATFGSYNEESFNKDRSDIDVIILSTRQLEWEEELEIEDYLQLILKKHFKHDNIHLTFINDFIYPFGELLIASKDKIILLEEKYLDYILGYSCFKRDREYLEIIREENLKEMKRDKSGLL